MFDKSYETWQAEHRQNDNDAWYAILIVCMLFLAAMVYSVAYDIGAKDQQQINEQHRLDLWLAR